MPSNHVYQMVKDKYGYLWIATTNGVVRYNGYNLKTYTIADGLPSNDVWSIHLDKKDRLWLLCFGNSPGYIKKNKYHETFVKNDSATISAERIIEHNDGITFIGKFREPAGYTWFWEKNDTIVNVKSSTNRIWYFYLKNNGELVQDRFPANNKMYTYRFNGNIAQQINQIPFDFAFAQRRKTHYLRLVYYDNEILYAPGQDLIYTTDLNTFQHDSIQFHQAVDKIIYADRYLFVLTGNSIHTFDSSFTRLDSSSIAETTRGSVTSAGDMIYLLDDRLWGKAVATMNNGLYIVPNRPSRFNKLPAFDAPGYKYIGYTNDTSGYWWNPNTGKMALVSYTGQIRYRTYPFRDQIRKIVPYNKEYSLLLFNLNVRLLSNKTGDLKELTVFRSEIKNMNFIANASDAIVNKDTVFGISSGGLRKGYIANDTFFIWPVYFDRCTGIVYDSLRNVILAHNTSKLAIFNKYGEIVPTPLNVLKLFGINQIENVIIDNKFGNIIIKSGDKLLCINPATLSYRQLFTNNNLADAKIFKHGDILIAAGKFGVSFCNITGPDSFSPPFTYYNEKFTTYRFVNDVHATQNRLILDTDNGLYSLDIPTANLDHGNAFKQPFSLIIGYAGNLLAAGDNDSFTISQKNTRVTFDVINPSGSGTVRYQYKINDIDTSWHELNSNEINLSSLTPGKYYTLILKVRDDAWKSDPIRLQFYTIPLWWQTNPGRTILLLSGIALLIGLIFVTVLITRKIIVQNNIKKYRLLELEVKSIHSQINPHFIFNTLNTTLHYIVKRKLDEAYDHVSSFSSLLRAYLKSSRHRYITLGEEINNLQNYIRLQQTRFENSFTYEILTDIPPGKTIFIPSLLLQPIVENAINHGLLPKNAPGHLKLAFTANAGTNVLQCVIDDDGIGRKKHHAGKLKDQHQRESYGSHLINELVDVLNKYENAGIEINYIDKELPQTGTTVIITIKNALKDG